jgi:hypothetical protein
MWERLLESFAEHPDVTLAYPTQRMNLSREVLSEVADAEMEPPSPT